MLVADRCRMRGLRGFFTRQQERQSTANLGLGSRPALGAEITARPLPRAATVCSATASVPAHARAYLFPSAQSADIIPLATGANGTSSPTSASVELQPVRTQLAGEGDTQPSVVR